LRVPGCGFELETRNSKLETGFSIVAAIFLLVVLALLGAFIVNIVGLQQSGQQLDVRGVRAYQAARAGLEWAAWQSLDPNNALNPAICTAVPTCPASPTTLPALAGSLAPFTVVVTCAETATTEGNREVRVFAVTAIATAGTPGNADYVSRELQARFSKCHDPTAAAPRCACG
jgi:MSHA biogenesis protein MshP